MGKRAVRVFKLSSGQGYSVVVGSGPHGSRVKVIGVYSTREEANKVAARYGRPVNF